MPTKSDESKLYLMQLQIDEFLDGELSPSQQDNFMDLVHESSECAEELRFARTMQDALMDLPMVDCPDSVLEPAYEIAARDTARGTLPGNDQRSEGGAWQGLLDWIMAAPLAMRLAVPAFAVAVFAVALLPLMPGTEQAPPQLAAQPVNSPATTQVGYEEYSPEEIAQALLELNTAIEYLNEVSQRTESMVGGRFLVTPLRDRINASFERAVLDQEDPLNNDPI